MNEQNDLRIQIDRLIDGELTQDETTVLLARCETTPEAWRTIALGMLEAREIKGALTDMLTEPTTVVSSFGSSIRRHALTWVLSAACLVCVGFLAGWFVPKQSGTETTVVDNTKSDREEDSTDSGDPNGQVVGFAQIHGLVGQQPPVPVIAGPSVDYEALLRAPINVPSEIARRCRNKGLAIQATRQVMAFEFEGQRFAIPMDKFGFRYVGNEVL